MYKIFKRCVLKLFPNTVTGVIEPYWELDALIWQDQNLNKTKKFVFPTPNHSEEVFLTEAESKEKRNLMLNDPWIQARLKSLHLSEIERDFENFRLSSKDNGE